MSFPRKLVPLSLRVTARARQRFSRAARKIDIAFAAAQTAHRFDTKSRLEGPNEYGLWTPLGLADDVQHVVHAVDEIDISVTRGAKHHGVALRTALAGMTGEILCTDIRFRLDDSPGKQLAFQPADERAAEQVARNIFCRAVVEEPRQSISW